MRDILFLSYDGLCDMLGQSQILPYLSGLAKRGWKIDVISCEKRDRFKQRKIYIEEICSESGINWYPLTYRSFPPVLAPVLNGVELWQKALSLHTGNQYKIVHCRSYIPAICGLKLKKRRGEKFIFDMRGFWADERVDGKLWNLKNPAFHYIYRYFKRKEKEFLENADAVISLTEAGKREIISSISKAAKKKTTVIPCVVDTDLFNPYTVDKKKRDKLRQKLEITNDDILIGYVGSLGTWYLLEEMLDLFKLIHDKNRKVRFLIVSKDEKIKVEEEAEKRNLPRNTIIYRSANREEVPLYLSLLDAGVFFIMQSYSKIASSPTKQGEFMSMGIPVYCNAGVGDSARLTEELKSGVVLAGFSREEMKRAANRFNELLSMDGDQIRENAIKHLSLQYGVEKYDAVYNRLVVPQFHNKYI